VTQSDGIILDPIADQECAEFQASMADRISNGEDLQAHPHMLTCERCTELVRELESIAEFAKLLMPIDAEPGDDLWIKIEGKLALEATGDAEPEIPEAQPEPEDEKKITRDPMDDLKELPSLDGMSLEGGIA